MATFAYLLFMYTPEQWTRPIRDFLGGELKREAGREPELKIGTEKMLRVRPAAGPEKPNLIMTADREAKMRLLFREIPKRTAEQRAAETKVPELPAGAGLLAVWMEGETRVAVMTDGPVREGEPWGQFTVEKITPEAVTLRHEAGERVVRLGEAEVNAAKNRVTAQPAQESRPAESPEEAKIRKLVEQQKSLDPSKLLQGFPQKMLDSLMGTTPKPANPQ